MSEAQRIDRSGPRAALLAGRVAALLLGAVLLLSFWTKAVDPHGFAEQIARDGLLPERLAFAGALLVIGIEAALGAALVAGRLTRPVLAASTLLMAGFFALAGWQFFVPPEDPSTCGCFGNLIQQTPGQHWLVNTIFLALAGLAWLGRAPRGSRRRAAAWLASAAAIGVAFALAAPRLPIDGWPGVTRLVPGADVASLGVTDVIPELAEGDALVLLIDRADEATRVAIGRVNELLALAGGPISVYGLAEQDEALEAEFFWAAGPAFDVRGAPYGLIKPLYRRLPRAFLVRHGQVVRVWNDIPDEQTLARLAQGEEP